MGEKPKVCASCGGAGQTVQQSGMFHFQAACSACGGAGEVIANPCGTCDGVGVVRGDKELEVKVPAGVDTGLSIRIPGKGAAEPRGGPPGNLFIRVVVDEHDYFERDGFNVHVAAPIPVGQAVMGGKVVVPTLDGDVELTIPAGTQPDERRILRQRGIEKLNRGVKGHMYVHYKVVVPKPEELTERQREIMQEFRDEEEKVIEPKSFFSRALESLGKVFSSHPVKKSS